MQTNEIKGFGGTTLARDSSCARITSTTHPSITARTEQRYYKTLPEFVTFKLVMTSNMIWGKTPPPLCDFMQWLDTEQSQEAKDHVEREARWAAERWQRMLHEEQMEEKRKKDQEDIQKRIEEVECH